MLIHNRVEYHDMYVLSLSTLKKWNFCINFILQNQIPYLAISFSSYVKEFIRVWYSYEFIKNIFSSWFCRQPRGVLRRGGGGALPPVQFYSRQRACPCVRHLRTLPGKFNKDHWAHQRAFLVQGQKEYVNTQIEYSMYCRIILNVQKSGELIRWLEKKMPHVSCFSDFLLFCPFRFLHRDRRRETKIIQYVLYSSPRKAGLA